MAHGQFSNNNTTKKVALVIFILMAILTIPVFLTGEEAEESVEHLAGISENLIEDHEELAEKAIWLMGFLGAFSLVGLISMVRKLSFAKTVTLITLLISLATFGVFAKVGNLGGQIRHSEIRANSTGFQGENGSGIIDQRDDDDD